MKLKILALLLAVCMMCGCLAGCADNGVKNYTGTETPEPSAAAATRDYAAAREKYPLDAVVMTVNGSEVTWAEYFYWLYYTTTYVEQYVGAITDFSAPSALDETQTYAQYLTKSSVDMVVQYHALEVNAKAAGAKLTAENEQYLAELLASDIVSCCGEEGTEQDFYDYLETVYVSPELYNYINSVSCLYTDCFDTLYGADGGKLSDAEVAAFVEANGYMTAKHILISTVDAEGVALGETEKAEKLALAQGLLAQLKDAKDQSARLALFDTLMNEYSEDTGLAYYPNGYCFGTGEMAAEFESAAAALGENQISDIVETNYGYHIILRLPTTPDDLVEYKSADEQYDLRYMAAVDAYDVLIGNWVADAEVVWADDFANLDLTKLFASHNV